MIVSVSSAVWVEQGFAPMLGPKAVWELCQASLIAKHHQKNPKKHLCGQQLERKVEISFTGTEGAAFWGKKTRLT